MDMSRAIEESDLPISITKQPPQSTGLNVLDLGYFTSIQGLKHNNDLNNVDELVDSFKNS